MRVDRLRTIRIACSYSMRLLSAHTESVSLPGCLVGRWLYSEFFILTVKDYCETAPRNDVSSPPIFMILIWFFNIIRMG